MGQKGVNRSVNPPHDTTSSPKARRRRLRRGCVIGLDTSLPIPWPPRVSRGGLAPGHPPAEDHSHHPSIPGATHCSLVLTQAWGAGAVTLRPGLSRASMMTPRRGGVPQASRPPTHARPAPPLAGPKGRGQRANGCMQRPKVPHTPGGAGPPAAGDSAQAPNSQGRPPGGECTGPYRAGGTAPPLQLVPRPAGAGAPALPQPVRRPRSRQEGQTTTPPATPTFPVVGDKIGRHCAMVPRTGVAKVGTK